MSRRAMLVTRDGWGVSRTCSADRPAGGELHVARYIKGCRWAQGDHCGRMFESEEEASAFCLERGYLQPYVNERLAVFKSVQRRKLATVRRVAMRDVMAATRHEDVVRAADHIRVLVMSIGCDVLDSLKYSNGVYHMARSLRRDIYAKEA